MEDKEILLEVLMRELKEVKEWHKKTFPTATLAGQLLKLEEEMNELLRAKTREEHKRELADILIVCAGLNRWDSKIGNYMVNSHLESMQLETLFELILAVNDKMKKNRKRVWKKSGDGRFHHTNKE